MNAGAESFIPRWLQKKNPANEPVPVAPSQPPSVAPSQPLSAAPHKLSSETRSVPTPDQHVPPPKQPVKEPSSSKMIKPAPMQFPSLTTLDPISPPAAGGKKSAWHNPVASLAAARSSDNIKEVSQKSSLKATASVYIPKAMEQKIRENNARHEAILEKKMERERHQREASSTPEVEHPTQPAAATADAPSNLPRHGVMVLEDFWTLYYIDRPPAATDVFDPYIVYEIDTVETFWRTFNNIPTVTRLEIGASYFLFREGVAPKWEDHSNIDGGAWSIKFMTARERDDTIDAVWDRLCAAAVGEAWSPRFAGTVNGVVAKRKERMIILQIWVTEKQETFPRELLPALQDIYPAFEAEYISHVAMHAFAVAREAEQASSPKSKKKKTRK